MLGGSLFTFFTLSTLLAPHVANAAVVSLFIPDAQPSKVTAQFLGTDSTGHTTWAIGNGQPSDTITASPIATMVAGPTDLHLVEDVQSALGGILHDDCGIKDGVAVCTIVLSGSASVRTVGIKTESASAFAVPVGATPPPAGPLGTQASESSATGTAARAGDTASVSGSGAPSAQTADGQGNGAVTGANVAGATVVFAALGIVFVMLL